MQSHTASSQSGKVPPAGILASGTHEPSSDAAPAATTSRPPLTAEQQKRNDEIFAASVGYNARRVTNAAAAISAAKKPSTAQRKQLHAALDALAAAKPDSSQQAAQQFSLLLQHRALDRMDLNQFAATLSRLTDWLHAQKEIGKIETKDGKLTRAGLLFRYHAFLAHELTNLSIELYGCARYAFQFIPMDGYVQRRIDPPGWPKGLGKHLPPRATKVFRALGIDSKRSDGKRR